MPVEVIRLPLKWKLDIRWVEQSLFLSLSLTFVLCLSCYTLTLNLVQTQPEIATSGLKKRVPLSNRFSNRFQKSTIRKVVHPPASIELRSKSKEGEGEGGGNSSTPTTTIYENYQQQFDTIGEETEL